MAETKVTTEERGSNTVPLESEGQSVFCQNCKDVYWWMYGDDCVPTSLSCGHTLCIKQNKAENCSNNPMPSHLLVSSSADNTSTDVIHQPATAAQLASSHGCTGDKETSAFSSPLVLDKIQSQDDAWRLLQHDEGFIRDWIVANVPDHVIFKMVGAGNPDTVVSTNVDSNNLMLNSSSAVMISSPPNVAVSAAELGCTPSSAPLTGMPACLGDTANLLSFEQQFLHYVVNKAAHDRPPSSAENSGEHDLQAAPETVNSTTQTKLQLTAKRRECGSARATSPSETTSSEVVQDFVQAEAGEGVGKVPHEKMLQGLTAQLSASKEASCLDSTFNDLETDSVLTTAEGVPKEDQLLPGLHYPVAALYSSHHPHSSPSLHPPPPNHLYQQQTYVPNVLNLSYGNPAGYSANPGRIRHFPGDRFPLPRDTSSPIYGSYTHPYSHVYPLHNPYGPHFSLPRRHGPPSCQRHPQYYPLRGQRLGRNRNSHFPRSFRVSPENPWFSKACSNSLNPTSTSVSAQPQIRFVQVLRPKSESLGQPEHKAGIPNVVPSAKTETESEDLTRAEVQEAAEAEVAVMKTRDMPHGTQVEDIYMVPQVWLNGGQACPLSDSTIQPACPSYSCDDRTQQQDCSSLPLGKVPVVHNSDPCQIEQDAADRFGSDLPDKIPNFDCPDECSLEGKPKYENQPSSYPLKTASENAQLQKTSLDDCSEYMDFRPVGIVTTVATSIVKDSLEPSMTTAALQERLDIPPPFIHIHSQTSAATEEDAADWGRCEKSFGSQEVTRMEDIQRVGSSQQIALALSEKVDANICEKSKARVSKLDPTNLKFSYCDSDPIVCRISETSLDCMETCKQNGQPGFVSAPIRTASMALPSINIDGPEIIGTKSTLPSAVIVSKLDAAESLPSRKRIQHSIASEYYNSSFEDQLKCYTGIGRRASSRKKKWYHTKNHPYGAPFDSSRQAVDLYTPSVSYSPGERPYYFDGRCHLPNSFVKCHHPSAMATPFPSHVEKPVNPSLGFQLEGNIFRKQLNTLFCSTLAAAAPCQTRTSVSPSELLSERSSGQGDYGSTFSSYADPTVQCDYHFDSKIDCGQKADADYGSGGLLARRSLAGGASKRLHFWQLRREGGSSEEDLSTEGWKIGASGQRINADDLEIVHWLFQEVTELNRHLQSEVLMNTEAFLALLKSSAYQTNKTKTSPPSADTDREIGDIDHLLNCILSLGQVTVQFGWWCRPHCWDESSERWGEMAVLASDVFEESVQRLNQLITFYLDHVTVRTEISDVRMWDSQDEGNESEISPAKSQTMNSTSASAVNISDTFQVKSGHSEHIGKLHAFSDSDYCTSAAYQTEEYATDLRQSTIYVTYVDQDDDSAADTQASSTTADTGLTEAYTAGFKKSGTCNSSASQSEEVSNTMAAQSAGYALPSVSSEVNLITSIDFQKSHLDVEQEDCGRSSDDDRAFATIHCSQECVVPVSWAYDRSNKLLCDINCVNTSATQGVVVVQVPTDPAFLTSSAPADNCANVGNAAVTIPDTKLTERDISNTTEIVPVINDATDSEVSRKDSNVIYTVPGMGKSESDKSAEPTDYIVHAAVIDDDVVVSPDQVGLHIDAGLEDLENIAHVFHDFVDENDKTPCPLQTEDDAFPLKVTTEMNNKISDSCDHRDSSTVIQDDENPINLFTVTVPVNESDGHIECTEEVISDAAIMASETVEVETDGAALKLDRMKEDSDHQDNDRRTDCKGPSNADTSVGKRKRSSKTPEGNWKKIKQGCDCHTENNSTKEGKWNLRSSRVSPVPKSELPRNSSRKRNQNTSSISNQPIA